MACRAVGHHVVGGRLAAAVSRAGGLGMIGMGSSASADGLRRELAALGDLDLPFGIGLVHWVMEDDPELFDVALAARPALQAMPPSSPASSTSPPDTVGRQAFPSGYCAAHRSTPVRVSAWCASRWERRSWLRVCATVRWTC